MKQLPLKSGDETDDQMIKIIHGLIINDDDDDVTTTTTTNYDVNVNTNNNNNNVLKFIKEKMGETIEKVVGVFKPKDLNTDVDMFQALNKTSLVGTTFAYDIACPGLFTS